MNGEKDSLVSEAQAARASRAVTYRGLNDD